MAQTRPRSFVGELTSGSSQTETIVGRADGRTERRLLVKRALFTSTTSPRHPRGAFALESIITLATWIIPTG